MKRSTLVIKKTGENRRITREGSVSFTVFWIRCSGSVVPLRKVARKGRDNFVIGFFFKGIG